MSLKGGVAAELREGTLERRKPAATIRDQARLSWGQQEASHPITSRDRCRWPNPKCDES